jgi:hypothetical protein
MLLLGSGERARTARPRLRDRIAVRCGSARLDAALAAGEAPSTSPALALRARALLDPGHRRALARSLNAILYEARHGSDPSRRAVSIARAEVLAAAEEIEVVVRRLLAPVAVDVRGVARVGSLLCDGGGPLYARGDAGELRRLFERAADELEPRQA